MRFATLRFVPLVVLAGCTFNTTVNHLADAPNVPPSDSVVVVTVAPNSAVLLGTVTVRGNANMVGPACQAQAMLEARKMGATHVIVRPAEASGSRGVRCTGDAYYLGPIIQG